MKPSVGMIVHFRMTADQAQQVMRRRTDGKSIAERIKTHMWPLGAQAHIGNPVSEGAILPMVITAVWPDEFGQGKPGVNGQVLMDGNDCLWVTSVSEGEEKGYWSWPPMVS